MKNLRRPPGEPSIFVGVSTLLLIAALGFLLAALSSPAY